MLRAQENHYFFLQFLSSQMRLSQENHYIYCVFELNNALRPRKPLLLPEVCIVERTLIALGYMIVTRFMVTLGMLM